VKYELYYWPDSPGRGEFVRLALEEGGADYADVARGSPRDGQGVPALLELLNGETVERPPFAPPFLKAGKLLVGQTANILLYLGPRLKLAPASEAGRLWTHQLQLTVTDFLKEVQDTHHPFSGDLGFPDQMAACRITAIDFLMNRAPKFLGYFERVLTRNGAGGSYLVGGRLTYADLSLFHMVEGLRFAFPKAMKRLERRCPLVVALHDRVAQRPRIKAYLASDRRKPFSGGVFRHYPELDP